MKANEAKAGKGSSRREVDALTPREQAFVANYLVHLNASRAARECELVGRADMAGQRMLAKPRVRAAIDRIRQDQLEALDVRAIDVLRELSKAAFANMLDYVKIGPDGDPRVDLSDLDRVKAAAIGEVVVETYVEGRGDEAREVKRVKFKLQNKLQALETLGKHLGLFRDNPPIKAEYEEVPDLGEVDPEDVGAHWVQLKANA